MYVMKNVVDSLYKVLNDSKLIATIFIYVQKVFDMVDHLILIQKLSNIGLRGLFSNMLKCYQEN